MTTDDRAARLERAIRRKREAARAARGQSTTRATPAPTQAPPIPCRPDETTPRLGRLQRGLWLAHRLAPKSAAYHLVSALRLPTAPPPEPTVLDATKLEATKPDATGLEAAGLDADGFDADGLDTDRLERAFRHVVARHRILRSTFRAAASHQDAVEQVIAPAESHPPSLERVRAAPGASVEQTAVNAVRRPFDLEHGPLVRLLRVEPTHDPTTPTTDDAPLLVLVLHHILADERSLELLWRELADTYARDEMRAGALPADEPALQYDDWVAWFETHSPDDETTPEGDPRPNARQSALDVWRRRLTPPPPAAELPFARTGRVDEAGHERAGRLRVRRLGPAPRDALRRAAAALGVTPFVVAAFAVRLLLHRHADATESEDGMDNGLVVTPASTRSHPATAAMLGYFTNPVALPRLVGDDESPRDSTMGNALRAFGRALRTHLTNADIAFQDLAEELELPPVRTMFVYQESSAPPALGSLAAEPVVLDLGEAKFDLTLFVHNGPHGLELAAEYRTARYDAAWIDELLARLEALLRALSSDAERSLLARRLADVSLLDLLGSDAARRLDEQARGPALDAAARNLALLPERIDERLGAARSGDEAAVIDADGGTSAAAFDALADALGARLRAAGVRAGDRVGLFFARSARMLAAVLACHRAGAAYVPLDPAYPPARTEAVLADADVAAVLTTADLVERLPTTTGTATTGTVTGTGTGVVIACDDEAPAHAPGDVERHETRPDDIAYLLYTSGSTGRPKGVVVTHENLRLSTAARLQVYDQFGLRPSRFLLLPSLAFDSSIAGLFWTLATGDTLVLPSDDEARDPRALARLLATQRVTCLLCVPSLWAEILRHSDDPSDLHSLDAVIVAGEACPRTLVDAHRRALPGVPLFNEYGPTEATVWATVGELTSEAPEGSLEPVSIGRPIPGARVDLLDRRGRPTPPGVPGEAWIVGPTVAAGYWRGEDQGRAEGAGAQGGDGFDHGDVPRYRTGDRMARTLDGRLLFLGRVDEQIKLRGLRIEPGEIEAALRALDGVDDAVVVARTPRGASHGRELDHDASHRRLVAFLESDSTAPADSPIDWRGAVGRQLPAHMVPSLAVRVDALPRLPNGKVDRRALHDRPLDSLGRVERPRADVGADDGSVGTDKSVPSTTEQALLALWHGLLGIGSFGAEALGLDDNFFEHGGHSLLVAEMVLAIERDLGATLAAADVFAHPTVRQLARVLDEGAAGSEPYEHLFPLQPRGSGAPLIVAIPHFFSPTLAERFRGERPVYGLRGIGLRAEGNLGRWPTMHALAAASVEELARRFPERVEGTGGFALAGYSFGCSLAVEIVRLLEARGVPLARLVLVAPMALNRAELRVLGLPVRPQVHGLRRPVDALSRAEALGLVLRDHNPSTLRPWRSLWRWLATRPSRHVLAWQGRRRRHRGLPLTPRQSHADVRIDRFRLHSRYRPHRDGEPVRTPTVILNPREPATDAAATWRPVFAGPLEVVATPDPHGDEAAIEETRRLLLAALDDLDVP
ncbi:MAG: amino acid adenylation domain-containing protein [Acidobacteriota bacterium]